MARHVRFLLAKHITSCSLICSEVMLNKPQLGQYLRARDANLTTHKEQSDKGTLQLKGDLGLLGSLELLDSMRTH